MESGVAIRVREGGAKGAPKAGEVVRGVMAGRSGVGFPERGTVAERGVADGIALGEGNSAFHGGAGEMGAENGGVRFLAGASGAGPGCAVGASGAAGIAASAGAVAATAGRGAEGAAGAPARGKNAGTTASVGADAVTEGWASAGALPDNARTPAGGVPRSSAHRTLAPTGIVAPHTEHRARKLRFVILAGSTRKTDRHSGQETFISPRRR